MQTTAQQRPLDGRVAVVTGASRGAGRGIAVELGAAGATVYVMWVEVLTHWVIFLPVSYVLGVVLGAGLVGAWLALPAYIIAYSLLVYAKYRRGTWLHMRV